MLDAKKPVLSAPTKVVIVGIYGIPGSGKSFLLRQLQQKLGQEEFEFYEGSKMIDTIAPGGLDCFRKMTEQDQLYWRQRAIGTIRQQCLESGKVGVVVGHFMFWAEGEDVGQPVYTPSDLDTYTHILYLDVAAELVAQRRQSDTERTRPHTSIDHLRQWQDAEKDQLRSLCRDHSILFSLLLVQETLVDKVSTLLCDFKCHTEAYNLSRAEKELDEVVSTGKDLKKMLVLDADRTLAAEDTGELFWATVTQVKHDTSPLKSLFGGPLAYSYTGFRQAVLLYEEAADEDEFDAICAEVASAVHIHPEFSLLLRFAAEQGHVGAVVVTCGLRAVWEKVLAANGLSDTVKVIGGGRIADGFVVTATVKANIVSRLKNVHGLSVAAFGDSPLDLPMLCAADRAFIVTGEEKTRSKTMDMALQNAMEHGVFRPSQALLPRSAKPRLNVDDLPVINIYDPEFIRSILSCHHLSLKTHPRVVHATDKSVAKLLMTPTRDANVSGPDLREAHRRIGRYLAIEYLSEMIGLEEYAIPHVQGHETIGFRVRGETLTSIVALMRGGEPMAYGVSDALPKAMFIHASCPEDVLAQHLEERNTVILVDSVVNSGKSIVQFVQHIRAIRSQVCIVVVAGVVQAQSLTDGSFAQMLTHDSDLRLIALRISENKFTGKGTTDTGNRLFSTTCLD